MWVRKSWQRRKWWKARSIVKSTASGQEVGFQACSLSAVCMSHVNYGRRTRLQRSLQPFKSPCTHEPFRLALSHITSWIISTQFFSSIPHASPPRSQQHIFSFDRLTHHLTSHISTYFHFTSWQIILRIASTRLLFLPHIFKMWQMHPATTEQLSNNQDPLIYYFLAP